MIYRSEAVKNFLMASTHNDLATLYSIDMECQVNVSQDGGDRVEGEYKGRQWHGWTDGITTWKSFRIPWNAKSEPTYTDSQIKWDLAEHGEGIGMTGWNWKEKKSLWVAFDFDAITGHSQGISDSDLQQIRESALDIDWVTVRKSTSGNGLHLYVILKTPESTENHNEHAALARSILGMMSAEAGCDFTAKVDACGGNMWVWHRKMKDTQGLEVIKKGVELDNVPDNWRDHVKVITGRRRKNLPSFISESGVSEADKLFEELTGQRSSIPVDIEHKRLIDFVKERENTWWWDSDHHMLVTHTYALLQAHHDLGLRGIFKTVSSGSDLNTQNCFCYPIANGGWVIRRFTPGVQEADTWDQDTAGWTRCYLNREPDLNTASKSFEGIENEKGENVFRTAEQAVMAAQALGVHVELPNWSLGRQAKLKKHKDGRLIIHIKHEATDPGGEMTGWLAEKGWWKRIFQSRLLTPLEPEIGNYDHLVRHLVSAGGQDLGWTIKTDNEWKTEPLVHVKLSLKSLGINALDSENILGSSIFKCWSMTNMPFQPEYPGDRKWNRDAAQYKYYPSQKDVYHHPTWSLILEHCGTGLDDVVADNHWCAENSIIKGSDYLTCWLASLFQEPIQPLPYLFMYGPQNSGKSIYHEAAGLLLTKGYQRADQCLSAKTDFNGELEGALLCVVEETDLNKNHVAYNRIKDWVTSRDLNIRHLYRAPYHAPNTTHWVQCANDASACPIFSGDTRITMLHVEELVNEIPKREMVARLEREAPDFMGAILALEIPKSTSRLNIPVITTSDKEAIQDKNKTALETFLDEECFHRTGQMISVAELWDKFSLWCDPDDISEWNKRRMGKELPPRFPKGRRATDGHHYIGNISFNPEDAMLKKVIVKGGKLIC